MDGHHLPPPQQVPEIYERIDRPIVTQQVPEIYERTDQSSVAQELPESYERTHPVVQQVPEIDQHTSRTIAAPTGGGIDITRDTGYSRPIQETNASGRTSSVIAGRERDTFERPFENTTASYAVFNEDGFGAKYVQLRDEAFAIFESQYLDLFQVKQATYVYGVFAEKGIYTSYESPDFSDLRFVFFCDSPELVPISLWHDVNVGEFKLIVAKGGITRFGGEKWPNELLRCGASMSENFP